MEAETAAGAHPDEHKSEGEARGQGGRLHGLEAAAEQEGNSNRALGRTPEHPLRHGRVCAPAGGDGVDDQRARVRRGDEKDDGQKHAKAGQEARQRQAVQQAR